MNRLSSMLVGVCLTMFLLALTPGAKADEWNRKTTVTFSGPVEIPGQVLAAGTYVFKLLDSPSDRNIVQIFDKDENHLYATLLALPDYRLKPAGKTVITFEERATGSPEAIRAWFYPGDNFGNEFVYPKVKAMELAKSNKSQHVLSMPNEMAANTKKPTTSASEPQVVAMKQAPVKAIEHGGTEVEVVEVHPAAPVPAKQPTQTASVKRLPQTASPLPLLALLGIVFLAAGFGVRSLSKQIR